MRLSAEQFAELVQQAVSELPQWVAERLDNVSILTAPWPTPQQIASSGTPEGHTLLGLYEGVPLPRRGRGYNLVPPDRITLFQAPLEYRAPDCAELRRLIARTIAHEIGHHFGFDEARLAQLGI